jgi:hypothetical protein
VYKGELQQGLSLHLDRQSSRLPRITRLLIPALEGRNIMPHRMYVVTIDRTKADSSREAQKQVLSHSFTTGFDASGVPSDNR